MLRPDLKLKNRPPVLKLINLYQNRSTQKTLHSAVRFKTSQEANRFYTAVNFY